MDVKITRRKMQHAAFYGAIAFWKWEKDCLLISTDKQGDTPPPGSRKTMFAAVPASPSKPLLPLFTDAMLSSAPE